MKLNIAYPATGQQILIEILDEKNLLALFDKRISHEVDGGLLGDEYKGYVFKITGGCDKQGFPMKQGVLTANRVRLLLHENSTCFNAKRKGQRRKKSVRGCFVSSENEIKGLTDNPIPRRLGPRRANRIRKMFSLEKHDDVRKYVVKSGKHNKGPKIQRLITPQRLQRKRAYKHLKAERWMKSNQEAKEYGVLLAKRLKEASERRIAKRLTTRRTTTRRTTIE